VRREEALPRRRAQRRSSRSKSRSGSHNSFVRPRLVASWGRTGARCRQADKQLLLWAQQLSACPQQGRVQSWVPSDRRLATCAVARQACARGSAIIMLDPQLWLHPKRFAKIAVAIDLAQGAATAAGASHITAADACLRSQPPPGWGRHLCARLHRARRSRRKTTSIRIRSRTMPLPRSRGRGAVPRGRRRRID
jgi:hypothetical protein